MGEDDNVAVAQMYDYLGRALAERNIKQLVVWGFRSGNHTHKYIHEAVNMLFERLGCMYGLPVQFVDDVQRNNHDWSHSLFFASPHVGEDKHIPLLDTCTYVLHFDKIHYESKRRITKYDKLLQAGQAIRWVVYRGNPVKDTPLDLNGSVYTVSEDAKLCYYCAGEQKIVMPWGTDQLPEEILENIRHVTWEKDRAKSKDCLFVGSVWYLNEKEIQETIAACKTLGLKWVHRQKVSHDENLQLVKEAYVAPAFQGAEHIGDKDAFYLPCRIIKNIGYGVIGVTNNPGVQWYFNGQLVYHENIEDCLRLYETEVQTYPREKQQSLMRRVALQETYVSRFLEIFKVFAIIKKIKTY